MEGLNKVAFAPILMSLARGAASKLSPTSIKSTLSSVTEPAMNLAKSKFSGGSTLNAAKVKFGTSAPSKTNPLAKPPFNAVKNEAKKTLAQKTKGMLFGNGLKGIPGGLKESVGKVGLGMGALDMATSHSDSMNKAITTIGKNY